MNEKHTERPAHGNSTVLTLRTAAGDRLELTLNQYRLALLGLVDFEADWEALETAAGFVSDGAAKAAIVREQLRPVAGELHALTARGVDAMEVLAARIWFRGERV